MALFGLWRADQDPSTIVTQSTVFDLAAYREMRRQFDACKAQGVPLVAVLRRLPVLANPFHGVDYQGDTVDMLVWCITLSKSRSNFPTSLISALPPSFCETRPGACAALQVLNVSLQVH